MRQTSLLCLALLASACARAPAPDADATPTAAQQRAADEASLLQAARDAGVSNADALKAKAELDRVYDDTSEKMNQAEAERNARDAAFKDEACIADCGR